MKLSLYIPAAVLAVASLTACSSDENVADRVFDPSAVTPANVLIDGMANEAVQTFTIQMSNPQNEEVTVTFGADMSLVKEYNDMYGASAEALPDTNYVIDEPVAVFAPNKVTSTPVKVTITDLNGLDRNKVYVLPITVRRSSVPMLESQKTRFIVVRGAALVNMVCNINENNCRLLAPSNATNLGGLSQITVQCLLKIDEFGKLISTICGIEGTFLLRVGDAGVPDNQLQLATTNGNVTDSSWQLETGKWIRFTFTYDRSTSEATLWLNGVKKATKTRAFYSNINWNSTNFYVGKSYDDNRYLDGCISELRVWNRVLSDAEITNDVQAYTVPVDSEGLVAYWKFNEGSGTLIHDYANGYDLTCASTPTWVEVTLPEN